MGQAINRLSARRVQTIAEPGRHADGGGLYLIVDASGAKRWAFKFKRGKKTYEMGLGGTRQRAAGARTQGSQRVPRSGRDGHQSD